MNKLTAKSFTRTTLALDIIGKIADGPYAGFHELATIKHIISLHDIITIEPSPFLRIVSDSPNVPTGPDNTCYKACELIQQRYGITDNVCVTIKKNIPLKGGLAGGSANAATVLGLLADYYKLDIETADMIDMARIIGQDVPFYFKGPTAFDSEAGLMLSSIPNTLRFDIMLVLPDFGVSTKDAYANIDYSAIGRNRNKTLAMQEAFANNDKSGVIQNIHNDFELSVFTKYPKLEQIKYKLLEYGCAAAALSGSGSTIMGILQSYKDFEQIKAKISYPCLLVSSARARRYVPLSKRNALADDAPFRARTGTFRWNSKQELCDFFNREYGLSRKIVDSEINEVMKTFKLRQGAAVSTQELWQKVGLVLEKKIKELEFES